MGGCIDFPKIAIQHFLEMLEPVETSDTRKVYSEGRLIEYVQSLPPIKFFGCLLT